MSKMKAVRIHDYGGPEVVVCDEIPAPEPGTGEVVVKIEAAAMNHLDLWVRKGLPKYPLPKILGSDGAGIIHSTGDGVKKFKVGDPVLIQPLWYCGTCKFCTTGKENYCLEFGIFGEDRNGTMCEYFRVNEKNAYHKPGNISFEEAAAFSLVGQTSYTMLVERARIHPGETVLIWGAGSGIGTMAVQIAKHYDCLVIATTGGDEKADFAKKSGADYVLDHYTEDISKKVKEITNGTGVDIIFEHPGAATWKHSLRSLGKGGRIVTCGATTGPEVEIDIRHLFFKQQSILGSTMGSVKAFKSILKLVENGIVKPCIDKVFVFKDAADAHHYLEHEHVFGKVILKP